jgi:uncharacterized membrane protein YsdA (DUF1294 family)
VNKKWMSEFSSFTLPIVLSFKYVYALFFLEIYTQYYGGGELTADAGRFFEESKVLYEVFQESPLDFMKFLFGLNNDHEFINSYLSSTNHWNAGGRFLLNDSRNVMRANALLLFISNGSVYIHFLLFSFASFLGAIDLFQFIKKRSSVPKSILIFIIVLAPSIAFWSSSIIKEPLLILGLFIFIRGVFDKLPAKNKVWRIILGGLLLVGFKPYVFIAVLLGLVYYLVFSKLSKSTLINLFFYGLIGSTALYISGTLPIMTNVISKQQEDFINVRDGGLYLEVDNDRYYYIYHNNRNKFEINGRSAILKEATGARIMDKNDNYNRLPLTLKSVGDTFQIAVQLSKAGSGIEVTPIRDNLGTMIKMIPEALFNTHIRPLPLNHKTWLAIPAFIENVIYMLGFIFALFLFRKPTSKQTNNMLWSLAITGIVISLIVGWTTPVMGAIVRYIIPAQAVLLIIILIKIDWTKLQDYFVKSN